LSRCRRRSRLDEHGRLERRRLGSGALAAWVLDDTRLGMTKPFLLVQLSDPHVGATWADGDPVAGLGAAVESVRRLPDAPDAVLMSGDLADNAADGEYELVRELLARVGAPLYVLPGNHDDRDRLRRHFDLPGAMGTPVQYGVDLGPLRLVVLDSTRLGEDRGELDAERLRWLDAELAGAPDRPTLLALHHPPVSTGIAAWDEIGLPAADRRALADVLHRHPQVRRVVAGHLHRTMTAELAGRAVLAVPSTYVQTRLSFNSDEIETAAEPLGFAVHALLDGELASHVQPVT
jgi:3',5'-cyclic-AMP phosphodiesterase